ncbi:MAG: acetate--CoA ligase family protein [Promethearchaeota archaeon]
MSQNNSPLEKILNPKSIAFYGANENWRTMGTIQMLNALDNGFKGKIYPIHPRLSKVLGIKAYKSIFDVPEVPDLAIIVISVPNALKVMEELGQKGVKHAIIVTGGFREVGDAEDEKKLIAIANKYGIRFLGPNCIGVLNAAHSLKENTVATEEVKDDEYGTFNCTWVNYPGKRGNVSIISQSGTFTCHTFMTLKERGLNLNKAISVGNEANIDICDCLEYLRDDPHTDVILMYIEEIKRGRLFLKLAKEITIKKPIIAIYVGGTEGGARAVSSHTGSMAGNDRIYNGVFAQSGIIRVYTMEELMDTARLFSNYIPRGIIPKGNRIAIATNSGGPAAQISDNASRMGLHIPTFSEETQRKIRRYVAKTGSVKNPVDYTFSIDPGQFYDSVPRAICKSSEVDVFISYGAFGPEYFKFQSIGKKYLETDFAKQGKKDYMMILRLAVERSKKYPVKYKIPFIYINPLGVDDEVFIYLNENGFPTFKMPHQATIAVKNLVKYGKYYHKRKGLEFHEES